MRILTTIYLIFWVVVTACVIYVTIRIGYPWWLGLLIAYFLFMIIGGTLAYWARSQKLELELEGKKSPPYLQYLFFPQGVAKLKEDAPKLEHVIIGIAATLCGLPLIYLGIALFLKVDVSQHTNSIAMFVVAGVIILIGILMSIIGIRSMIYKSKYKDDTA